MGTIKNMIEDTGADVAIPLPNVSGKDLSKVIEYCTYKVNAAKKNADGNPTVAEEDVKTWENEFVKVDQGTLFQLILAANCFNIKDDFTPEEEEEVRREHQWAFD